MKYILILALSILLGSCGMIGDTFFTDEQPDRVNFGISAEKNDTYREVRIYGFKISDADTVTFDSTIHNAKNFNGIGETFNKDKGFTLSFFAEDLLEIDNGWFEVVGIKKDFTQIRQRFGKITDGKAHKYYDIVLASSSIVIEEL